MLTDLKSKYKLTFVITILLYVILPFTVGVMISYNTLTLNFQTTFNQIHIIYYVSSYILIGISIYSLFKIIKLLPIVSINKHGIYSKTIINAKKVNWTEIKQITLTEYHPFELLFTTYEQAITITLENNDIIRIWINYYKNSALLCQILEQSNFNTQNKRESESFVDRINTEKNEEYIPSAEFEKVYNTPIYYQVYKIIFIVLALLSPTLISKALLNPLPLNVISIGFLITMMWILIYPSYYFIITESQLIIKHSIFRWKTIRFDLKEIRTVIEGFNHKGIDRLTIMTNDFVEKTFASENLTDKMINELLNELQNKGVEIQRYPYNA